MTDDLTHIPNEEEPVPTAIASSSVEGLVAALGHTIADRLAERLRASHPSSQDQRPLLTKQDVADRLLISVRTVDTLLSEGAIVPVKVRGQIRFTPESVDTYIRRASRTERNGRGS